MKGSQMGKWEASFESWGSPPGQTEKDRCDNVIGQVRKAIAQSSKLSSKNVSVEVQGSYRNNTNVRADSDVDVTVLCSDVMLNQYPDGMSSSDFGEVDASYTFGEFKNDVQAALTAYFGTASVKRGNKTINLRQNSYRVDADVTPVFEHRRYLKDKSHHKGVALLTDAGFRIYNWHEQHYGNGVDKNKTTSNVYKKVVRILKKLENKMVEDNASPSLPGFFVECLVWNVPNLQMNATTYEQVVKNALFHICDHTKDAAKSKEWGEVSELKYLFAAGRTPEQAKQFTHDAWNYLGFGG